MSFKMDFVGFDELANDLNKIASNELAEVEKESLAKGAEIVKKNQESNWNRSHANQEHIQDNIKVGRAYESAEGRKVSIAPKMSLRWRAKFVEYGTSYQSPQAPIQKSLDQSEGQVAQAMMSAMEKVIK